MERIDPYRLLIRREGRMLLDAVIFLTEDLRIEPDAVKQLQDAASMRSVEVALATPDIHLGYGVPIGCVMATTEVVVPAAVGYDVNCGMRLVSTPLEADEVDFKTLAHMIHREVPLGEGKKNLRLEPGQLRYVLSKGIKGLLQLEDNLGAYGHVRRTGEERSDIPRVEDEGSLPGKPEFVSDRAITRGASQLGTLGGGNHFIELQVVDRVEDRILAERFGLHEGQFVAMIHTGSRGFGHQVAGDYMKTAEKLHARDSPSRHLAYLLADEEEGERYIGAMYAAANFAYSNRQVITSYVRHVIRRQYGEDLDLPLVYDVTHNMAKLEEHRGKRLWVHRKGATRAFPPERMTGTPYEDVGQPVLIPGSMGTASYLLVAGPGAEATLYSVNHGAGRTMSRTAAAGKRTRRGKILKPGAVTFEALREAMQGIVLVAESKAGALEEAPQAYKDIDKVTEAVVGAGLARVVARMRPKAVLKG